MSEPMMPPDLREQVIEILAAALVADVGQHPELYGLEPPPDRGLAAPTGEIPRDSTRSPVGRRSPARRGRRRVGVEADQEAG